MIQRWLQLDICKQGIVMTITQIFNVQPKPNLVFKTIDDSGMYILSDKNG